MGFLGFSVWWDEHPEAQINWQRKLLWTVAQHSVKPENVELRRNCGGHSAPRLFGLGEQRAEKDRFRWHRRQAELDSGRGHLHVGRQDIV